MDAAIDRIRLHGAVPRHVAVIMDGNGRWATGRSLPRPLGHHAGMKSVREVVAGCLDAGVEVLTLFAFSRENWQRPATEIEALMGLLEEYIARESSELRERGVRVRVRGDLERLSPSGRDARMTDCCSPCATARKASVTPRFGYCPRPAARKNWSSQPCRLK
jgi:undecaprenyl diphosphate synthase